MLDLTSSIFSSFKRIASILFSFMFKEKKPKTKEQKLVNKIL